MCMGGGLNALQEIASEEKSEIRIKELKND